MFSLSAWAPVALQPDPEAGIFFFARRLLFLESTLGTLCTDGPYKCADGLIKL